MAHNPEHELRAVARDDGAFKSGNPATCVLWVDQFSPGRTAGFSAELILAPTPTGDWRVQEMRRTGAS